MQYYKEFTVIAEPFIPEIISGLIWELQISGINEEVNCLKVFAAENSPVTIEQINLQLQKLADQKMIFNYNVEEQLLEDKNWNEEWEKSVNVIEVTDKIVIKQTFREYRSKPGQIIITIDPKMSFGTGEHQTTKLVLQFLEDTVEEGMKMLDVGSGTGILSIAAVKLGAQSAIAVDNDEWCYLNGKENTLLNSVQEKIDVRLGIIQDINETNFDLITANIQKNILLEIAGEIHSRLKPGGTVILSGLLYNDEADIVKRYSALNFEIQGKKLLDEWIAIKFKLGF
jgi:ribosomal protein L11 methyltransferase